MIIIMIFNMSFFSSPCNIVTFPNGTLGKLLNDHLRFKVYYQNILIKVCGGDRQQHPNRFLIGNKKMKNVLNWFDHHEVDR
jgi:hypothetical protein